MRTRTSKWIVAGTFALSLAGGGRARAQNPPPSAARVPAAIPGDGRTPAQLRTEVLEHMRALRAWRIVDALKLDEATSARLFPLLAKYDDRELALTTERRDIVRQLRAEIEAAHPDDGRLNAAIGRLLANRGRQRALEDDRIKDLRKVLSPVQQGKLVLLLPRIEREFARRVREIADGQRPLTGDDSF
jgi:hypothetical protein